jgi:hypothetical protein
VGRTRGIGGRGLGFLEKPARLSSRGRRRAAAYQGSSDLEDCNGLNFNNLPPGAISSAFQVGVQTVDGLDQRPPVPGGPAALDRARTWFENARSTLAAALA